MARNADCAVLTPAVRTIYGNHMPRVSKTTIYLDDADYRRLKQLARAARRPAAALVREAVADYVRRHAPARRPRSLAAGRSGHPDLGERSEELLEGLGRE